MSTLIDSHVHFHPGYQLDDFLSAAAANATRFCPDIGEHDVCVLLLAQIDSNSSHQIDPLQAIIAQAAQGSSQNQSVSWRYQGQPDDTAVHFTANTNQPSIVMIAGRQLVTEEGLELLALGTAAELSNDQPLEQTIQQVLAAEGIPVIPWGFGKWWFRRGRILSELLTSPQGKSILLADSGCRTDLLGPPRQLRQARTLGVSVLAGSDPLPLPDHLLRVVSYGNRWDDAIDMTAPTLWLRETLLQHRGSPPTFGTCRGLVPFFGDQLRIRMK